jgi:hypothetical protein
MPDLPQRSPNASPVIRHHCCPRTSRSRRPESRLRCAEAADPLRMSREGPSAPAGSATPGSPPSKSPQPGEPSWEQRLARLSDDHDFLGLIGWCL